LKKLGYSSAVKKYGKLETPRTTIARRFIAGKIIKLTELGVSSLRHV
jgi:hypothetical protein